MLKAPCATSAARSSAWRLYPACNTGTAAAGTRHARQGRRGLTRRACVGRSHGTGALANGHIHSRHQERWQRAVGAQESAVFLAHVARELSPELGVGRCARLCSRTWTECVSSQGAISDPESSWHDRDPRNSRRESRLGYPFWRRLQPYPNSASTWIKQRAMRLALACTAPSRRTPATTSSVQA